MKLEKKGFLTNAKTKNKKYILLNNLESKHSLLVKCGQFMSYYKKKVLLENSTKTANWKLDPHSFASAKN